MGKENWKPQHKNVLKTTWAKMYKYMNKYMNKTSKQLFLTNGHIEDVRHQSKNKTWLKQMISKRKAGQVPWETVHVLNLFTNYKYVYLIYVLQPCRACQKFTSELVCTLLCEELKPLPTSVLTSPFYVLKTIFQDTCQNLFSNYIYVILVSRLLHDCQNFTCELIRMFFCERAWSLCQQVS